MNRNTPVKKFGKESSGKKVRERSTKKVPERKFLKEGSGKTAGCQTPAANRRAQARTMGGAAMSDLLSNGMLGGFSVVKESLTAQDLSRMATIRKFRRVRRSGAATIRNLRRVRFLRLARYSENPNIWHGVVRNFRRTDTVCGMCLIPSNSPGLESPSEVRV
jgi:hypothetical protein